MASKVRYQTSVTQGTGAGTMVQPQRAQPVGSAEIAQTSAWANSISPDMKLRAQLVTGRANQSAAATRSGTDTRGLHGAATGENPAGRVLAGPPPRRRAARGY